MKKNILVFLLFLLLIGIFTFPLFLNTQGFIPGFFSTDEPYGGLWESWREKFTILHKLPFFHTDLIAYPFGMSLYNSGFTSLLGTFVFYFLSFFTNPAFTYTITAVTNFWMSAIFLYILMLRLFKNPYAAFLSAVIFVFCPYQHVRSWQHLGLTYNQWIPLCLLAVIALKEGGTRKNKVLFVVSFLLLFSFDWSIMYMTVVSVASFLLFLLFRHFRKAPSQSRLSIRPGYLKSIVVLSSIVAVLLLPQFYPVIKNRLSLTSTAKASVYNFYKRPFEDLFVQSARPLSYLLPSSTHPVFGGFTEQFVGTKLYGASFTEHTLYLGWVPLLLAFLAIKRLRKKKVKDESDFYVGFFVFLGVIAWLFSQPPWLSIFGLKIYMPSFFMYKVLPMYRAYCRFGIVLSLAVAVVAGRGLMYFLEKRKTAQARCMVTALISGLVLFEFWNYPPYRVIDVSRVPEVYYWLKAQPDVHVIAEYPLDARSPNELYKFYQSVHEKKLINGTLPETEANRFAQGIVMLSDPATAGVLRWMGVRFVLVHKDGYLKTELARDRDELDMIPRNNGLRLIKSFPVQICPRDDIICLQATGPIDVYEIIATVITPKP